MVSLGVRAQTLREGGDPGLVGCRRQPERKEETGRLRALGGEVGQVDAQRLAGDCVRRIVGKEVHAADDRVRRQHDVVAGGRGEDRRIVDQAERAGMACQRLEIPGDETVLAGFRRLVAEARHPAACSNSPARIWRASWSRTALIIAVSSLSTKALATPTYSEITARAGMSVRLSSS